MWLAAQDALGQLSDQSGEPLENSQQVTEYMQQLLERERETTVERDEVAARKREVEAQIERPASRAARKISAWSRWPNVSAACCCRKFTMTSPSTTRLTSRRCTALRATLSWCRICRWCVRCLKGWKIARKIFT